MEKEKLLRGFLGLCTTVLWMCETNQCTYAEGLRTIQAGALKAGEELGIDLSSESQLKRLKDEGVEFLYGKDEQ